MKKEIGEYKTLQGEMDDVLAEAGSGIEQKVLGAEQIVETIAGLSSELEQDLYLKELARRSGIDLEQLKQVKQKGDHCYHIN